MVGLLIITHNKVGKALFDAATSVLGNCPFPSEIISVSLDCDPGKINQQAQLNLTALNKGDGVLIITDMYGSTPSNIATSLASDSVMIVSGINMPMLVRIMNYPELPLNELANKAVSGGQSGVIIVE